MLPNADFCWAIFCWVMYITMALMNDALRFASFGFLKAKLQKRWSDNGKVDLALKKMEAYFDDCGRNLRELEWGNHLFFFLGVYFFLSDSMTDHTNVDSWLEEIGAIFLWVTLVGALFARGISEPFAEAILIRLYPVWRIWHFLMTPLTWTVHGIQVLVQRVSGHQTELEEEEMEQKMLDSMEDGSKAGLLEESEREMIENLIEFKDLDVGEIMTPRTEMAAVTIESNIDAVISEMVEKRFSRIMIYKENRDNVVGFVHVRDLLPYWQKEAQQCPSLESLMHSVYYVPETKTIRSLFQEFKIEHLHIAVVLDEYGGTAGLITLEDILEEIVGDIVDEHQDEEEKLFVRISENQVRALGRMRVSELEEELDVEFKDDDSYDSIGGLLIAQLGRIPSQGEQGEIPGMNLQFKVLDANERRVEEVLFTLTSPHEDN